MKVIFAVTVVTIAAAVAGCGAAGESEVRAVAQRFADAPTCALLAPRARDGTNCDALPALPHGAVTTVSTWGDEAQARTGRDVLFLHEFPTGWLVTGAGCHPRNEQVYDCSVGGR